MTTAIAPEPRTTVGRVRGTTGDRGRDSEIASYLPRIAAICRRFRAPGVDLADLVQEGWLGLLEARRRFDPERGVPFWAYAAPWVHGAIYRLALDQRRAVRLPAAAQAELVRLRNAGRELAGRDGQEPAVASLAERAGLSVQRAERILAAARAPRSFQETLGSEAEGTALIEMIPDPAAEDAYENVLTKAAAPEIGPLLRALSARERDVIARRFGLAGASAQTLADIGRGMGVTRERVRQIEAGALGKLRTAAG